MHRSYHCWFSRALGRDMELLVFGHAGARVLCFPPSLHPFDDWENRGLVASLAPQIERGHFQLFCVDQIDRESWYGRHLRPSRQSRNYQNYQHYLRYEVLPFTQHMNADPFLICAGPSFGAFHAFHFALCYPELVGRVLGMSGFYDITRFSGGYDYATAYINNPMEFIANELYPGKLAAIRKLDIILAVGRDDPLAEDNHRLSEQLWGKQVWLALRLWDGFAHDWPVWARMLPLYIGGHD